MGKRIISFFFLICFLIQFFVTSVSAATVKASGVCGVSSEWKLYSDGEFVISGEGDMMDFGWAGEMPWYDYNDEIKKIIISDGITTISEDAFDYCKVLETVVIGDSLSTVDAFFSSFLDSLISISVDEENMHYSSLDGVLFDKDMKKIIKCPEQKSGAYIIPRSVETVGRIAFNQCTRLTSITVPNSVTEIEYAAFSHCELLTYVNIPNSVTTIADSVFSNCVSLPSISVPESVTSIGVAVFDDCSKLSSVKLPNNITKIENHMFRGCKSLETIELNNQITSLGKEAFMWCESLSSIKLPQSLTTIGDKAFSGCESLVTINLPASLLSIGENVFKSTSSLQSITVNSDNPNYSSDENGVLYNKNKSRIVCYPIGRKGSYIMPDTVTELSEAQFELCEGITEVELSNSLTVIPMGAFAACAGLKSVTIGTSIKSIDTLSFWNCSDFTVYYLGSNEDWNEIAIADFNDELNNAEIIFSIIETESPIVKRAKALLENGQYEFCKSESFPHTFFANELGDAFLMSAYYEVTEDIANLKNTDFYEIILYEALFKEDFEKTAIEAVDDVLNENALVEFIKTCNEFYTDALGDRYYSTSEFLDKKIGMSEEAIIKSGLATKLTKEIGGYFEKIQFVGKTFRELYDVFVKAYSLSFVSYAQKEALTLIKNETTVAELKNAVDALVNEIESSFESIVVLEMLEYTKEQCLQKLKKEVFEFIETKYPPLFILKYAYKTGKFVADKVYNAKEISFDALCIIAINNTDAAIRRALLSSETQFYISETEENASVLIALADYFKELLMYGCDIGNGFVENVATGGVTAKLFGKNTKYDDVANSISSIKFHLENYDFYSQYEQDTENEAKLETSVLDFANNENCHILPESKEELADEIEEYINTYQKVTGITLNTDYEKLEVGDKVKLKASIYPQNATNKSVTWTSSDENIVTVENGVVTAKNIGSATITAVTNSGAFKDSCEIKVVSGEIEASFSVEDSTDDTSSLNGKNIIFTSENIPGGAVIIISSYDVDGKLLKCAVASINSRVAINLTDNNTESIKAFIWENLVTMQPLCTVKAIYSNEWQ